jgi:hypothetical protein
MSAVPPPPAVSFGVSAPISEPALVRTLEMGSGRGGFAALLCRGRSTRVLLLAGLVTILSAADLYITAMYLLTIGMAEENPLARLIMSHGSIGYLSAWKAASVLPCLILMVAYRRRLSMELLGWVASAVLVNVMLRWVAYADETDLLLIALQALEEGSDHRWVSLARTPT